MRYRRPDYVDHYCPPSLNVAGPIPENDGTGAIQVPAVTAAIARRPAAKGSARASGNSAGRSRNPHEAGCRLQISYLWIRSHTRDRTGDECRFGAVARLLFHARRPRHMLEYEPHRGLAMSSRGSERISSRRHP